MKLWGVNSKQVDADAHGRLKTRSISRSEMNDASKQEKAFSITSAHTTAGADEEFIYIKNDHATDYFEVHQVIVGSAVSAVFTVSVVTGAAGGAGAITATALNLKQTTFAKLSCTGDAEVTGLTIGATIGKARTPAGGSETLDFKGSVLLPPNAAIAISSSGTGACEATVVGHFDGLEG